MGAVIGPPGEAVEELYDPYHRCAGRAAGVLFSHLTNAPDYYAQGGSRNIILHEKNLLFQDKLAASPLGASVMPNLESDVSQFWPFPYLAFSL